MQAADRISYAQYLDMEASAELKHEYVDGVIVAMSGGTIEHGRLAMAIGAALGTALGERGCRVLSSDVRVRVEETNRSTYPDLSVVCGDVKRASDDNNAIVNPIVVVEVLSDSTEQDDRGSKFAHYRRLKSLRHYVLVSQAEPRVEVFSRTEAGWLLVEYGPGEVVQLESLETELDMDALYRDAVPVDG